MNGSLDHLSGVVRVRIGRADGRNQFTSLTLSTMYTDSATISCVYHIITTMSSISGALRSIGATSFRQTPGPSQVTRLRIRNIHQSPLSRRAPVPNPPRPAPTNGSSTIAGTVGNGSRNGAGASSGASAGAGSGGKKKASAHALWYREIVPGMSISL